MRVHSLWSRKRYGLPQPHTGEANEKENGNDIETRDYCTVDYENSRDE